MEYIVKYKKGFFWKKIKVKGHRLDKECNRMDFFLKDGSVLSIPEWSKYFMFLGQDWLIAQKEMMEKESGIDIKLAK